MLFFEKGINNNSRNATQRKKNSSGEKFFFLIVFALINFLMVNPVYGQAKSNLELFYSMTDSSAVSMINELPAGTKIIKLEINSGFAFSILNNRLLSCLAQHGVNLTSDSGRSSTVVKYAVDNAKTEYSGMFRSGLFGSYYVNRKIILTGSFVIIDRETKSRNFNYLISDTVKVNEVKDLENISFPFTRGELPPEPFLSSLVEPAVAVASAALAVVLFFTVRSK